MAKLPTADGSDGACAEIDGMTMLRTFVLTTAPPARFSFVRAVEELASDLLTDFDAELPPSPPAPPFPPAPPAPPAPPEPPAPPAPPL